MDYKKVVVYWKEFEIPKALDRDLELPMNTDLIITITGPRKAGKSYRCYQFISQLKESGINSNNIFFINFDDERLENTTADDLDNLLNTYLELYKIDKKQPLFLFFDEIQNVKNWDKWVRRINSSKKNIRFILTGSSAKHLSKEISTKLRGRTLNFELFPISFKELLKWKKVEYNLRTVLHSNIKTKILSLFNQYVEDGGYPKVVLGEEYKNRLLQTYYEVMILRDIVERYNVRDVKQLKVVANLLATSVSKEFSYNKLKNKMESIGFDISKSTIIDYMDYFDNAYLFFQHLKYEYSVAKQLGSIKKIYCVDNGLLNTISFRFQKNYGSLLENVVFVELKRRGIKCYYHKNGESECDFVVQQKNHVIAAIQVTKQLNDITEEREVNGLLNAMEKYKLDKGYILTENQSGSRKSNGKRIEILPVWYFLLASVPWSYKIKK